MPYANAADLVIECLEQAFGVTNQKTILQFFEEGFKLTDDDRFKDFKIDYSPWIRALCKWFDDPETEWIYLVQGSQTTKTTFMMGCLLYASQYLHGAIPCLWVQSTEEEASQFISNRLRPFLDEAGRDAFKDKRWKKEAFRVFNASVKVGFASTVAAVKSKPARLVIGDECSIWRVPIDYVKKRTRTFKGKRKGIFGTTPPEDGTHFSWVEATAANFFQWWVECPRCAGVQGLRFSNLQWYKKSHPEEAWNMDKVAATTRYICEHCKYEMLNEEKEKIIQTGRAVCVDHKNYRQIAEKPSKSKTLQISSLYSIFTTWGELAVNFLEAKHKGAGAIRIFHTDELAEAPGEISLGEYIKSDDLRKFVDPVRVSGMLLPQAEFYTTGTDVQRGGELYYVVVAWVAGAIPSGHIVEYGKTTWKDSDGKINWDPLLQKFAPYGEKIWSSTLDSSDGVITSDVYDFANWAGYPYLAIKDNRYQNLAISFTTIEVDPRTRQRMTFGQKLMLVNSYLVKNEIAAAFQRTPGTTGAWSFPSDAKQEFFTHLTNECRVKEKRGAREITVWRPRYSGAQQHWFSALVYATSAMHEYRHNLVSKIGDGVGEKTVESSEEIKDRWINFDNWRIK